VQHDFLSKNLLAGEKLDNSRIMPSHIASAKSLKAELPDPPDKNVFTSEFQQSKSNRDHHNSRQVDRECTQPSIASMANYSVTHQNCRRTSNGSTRCTEGTDATTAPTDSNGVIEQIERGVYATVVTSPGGKKCIKRIRFR
jgi:hypothetical protein